MLLLTTKEKEGHASKFTLNPERWLKRSGYWVFPNVTWTHKTQVAATGWVSKINILLRALKRIYIYITLKWRDGLLFPFIQNVFWGELDMKDFSPGLVSTCRARSHGPFGSNEQDHWNLTLPSKLRFSGTVCLWERSLQPDISDHLSRTQPHRTVTERSMCLYKISNRFCCVRNVVISAYFTTPSETHIA